ncbi:unnamed protein product [Tilletia caries]|uniref:CCHC-type domain-containing protein n=3 Tax=Tilletia TaxID=13289 RepID=A0A8X7STB8_9BASI|nr:hypothetical protein CF335_g8143 [Tilletia laevis]KAE8239377.1 hypothetical protein A4X06_0g8290 [Tilletia controversa]KAE8240849.1 hypothetical protein A4X03_0g8298 [Tilletia caries]CAD6915061.1 unnamed protein product [Tilletia caries]CAD6917702.1 unnamed protein product [Tilletia caries]
MSDNIPTPPALAAALRVLERFPFEDRAEIEQAIRDQYEEDQEEADEQAARDAEEEAERLQEEQIAADIEAQRQAAALREEEAHLAAAKTLVDFIKAQEGATEPKDKIKKVVQDDDLGNSLDLLVATPSQKIRDKIKACDYIDLWHLTAEGMAAATRSKLSGNTSFELGQDGSFKIKDSVVDFKGDQDLPMAVWITALGHYVRIMQEEGVADNIVRSMIRLNHTLINHPDFDRHGVAIRCWHQNQRRQWVLSGTFNPEGKRFNLGKLNPLHFDEICLRLMEERAERRLAAIWSGPGSSGGSGSSGGNGGSGGSGGYGGLGGSSGSPWGGSGTKRSAPSDPSSSAPRTKAARTLFRCFVCFSTESGHPYRTCDAKARVDGKEQHAIRGSGGRIVFADSLKPICIDYQLKGCSTTCRSGAVHRCANCGVGGHGASSCSV